MSKYLNLQNAFYIQNETYNSLLNNYTDLQANDSQLQQNYNKLNVSFQEYLLNYSENMVNVRNLIYIFAAATAIFLGTTVYLSKSTDEKNVPPSKETNNK